MMNRAFIFLNGEIMPISEAANARQKSTSTLADAELGEEVFQVAWRYRSTKFPALLVAALPSDGLMGFTSPSPGIK